MKYSGNRINNGPLVEYTCIYIITGIYCTCITVRPRHSTSIYWLYSIQLIVGLGCTASDVGEAGNGRGGMVGDF